MSKYRTEFMALMAELVKSVYKEKPLMDTDFSVGADYGRKELAHTIGMHLAGMDVRPQTNDQWEAEVDHWTMRALDAEDRIQHLENLCAQYADEVRNLKDRLNQ